jgi:2-polyprenyl-6-methoxyphenol hydroxylase-like FAD-dependent oxidoreductase
VLAELGVLAALEKHGARLKRLDGRLHGGKRKVLDVRYDALGPDAHGLAVHRAALFDQLLNTAHADGATLEYGKEGSGVETSGNGAAIQFGGKDRSPTFDLIVDALGVRSPLVKRVNSHLPFGALWANAPFPAGHGFDESVLSQRYRSADVSSGVMPIGSIDEGGERLAAFFWTLRADAYPAWRDAPLDHWKAEVLALWPEAATVLAHFTSHDQFVFAQYAHHTAKFPVEGRVVHIGDAWHAASPQLGQGANMALLDALALANALNETDDIDAALSAFVKARRGHVRLYQTISWLFTPVYQSNLKVIPALRDVFAQPLSVTWPMPKLLASIVAGTLGSR